MSSEILPTIMWEDVAVLAVATHPPANAIETLLNMGVLASHACTTLGEELEEDWYYDASEAVGILGRIGLLEVVQDNVLRLSPYGWHLMQDILAQKIGGLIIHNEPLKVLQPLKSEWRLAQEMAERGELDHLTKEECDELFRLCDQADTECDVVIWDHGIDYPPDPYYGEMIDIDPDQVFGYDPALVNPDDLTQDGWVSVKALDALGEIANDDKLGDLGYFDTPAS